jgi:hypothetical protein
MRRLAFIVAALAMSFTTAASAEPIDACSLLAEADLVELGLSKDSVPSRETQPGGVQACKYRLPSAGNASDGMVSIILSQAVPERVLQLRALLAKAQDESTPAQLQARGEYYEGKVMCKVASAPQQESSQCLGASEQSVVAFSVSRPNSSNKSTYPASHLRIITALVARVTAKGG